jgi:hypothetical protein
MAFKETLMANFCAKCGAALSPDTKFCSSCGTSQAEAAQPSSVAPPQTPAYQSAYPAPAYQTPGAYAQPAAVSPPSGNSGVKIVLIIAGVLVGIVVLVALVIGFGVWRISRTVHTTANGVTFSTPGGGTVVAGNVAVSDADLGIASYPDAVHEKGGMQIKTPNASVVSAIYSTPDPVSKVMDYYKGKLGGNISVMQTGSGTVLTAGEHGQETTMVTIVPDASDSSKTKIIVTHTIKR